MSDAFLPTQQMDPRPRGMVELEVRDRRGSLLQYYRAPMHSYVANFSRVQGYYFSGRDRTIYRHNAETTFLVSDGNTNLVLLGVTADDVKGILVGTKTNAVAGTDRKLGSRYAHGSQTNQFMYQAGTMLDPSPTFPGAGTVQFRHQRTFYNQSGASLIVNETGLAGRDAAPAIGGFLFARDRVGPVSVPNLTTLTVTYTFYTVS